VNPLTSIRQLLPGMGASGLTPTDGALPSASIPSAELRQLNAAQAAGPGTVGQGNNVSFGSWLDQMVQDVNAKQGVAAQSLQDLQSGQNTSLHQTMIAVEEASVSFQLMVEVRNRLLDSYQELMRMQV
jgi:flagellar hook-basal body complex protein FliE